MPGRATDYADDPDVPPLRDLRDLRDLLLNSGLLSSCAFASLEVFLGPPLQPGFLFRTVDAQLLQDFVFRAHYFSIIPRLEVSRVR